jgi:hypothetical protein
MSGSQNSENSKDSFVSSSRFNTLYPPFKRHKHWNEQDLYWRTPSSKSAWGDTYARMSSENRRSSPEINQEHISNVGSVDSQVEVFEESQLPADHYSPMYVCLFYYYSMSNPYSVHITSNSTSINFEELYRESIGERDAALAERDSALMELSRLRTLLDDMVAMLLMGIAK